MSFTLYLLAKNVVDAIDASGHRPDYVGLAELAYGHGFGVFATLSLFAEAFVIGIVYLILFGEMLHEAFARVPVFAGVGASALLSLLLTFADMRVLSRLSRTPPSRRSRASRSRARCSQRAPRGAKDCPHTINCAEFVGPPPGQP